MDVGNDSRNRSILWEIAHRTMLEKGLIPDFSPRALAELAGIRGPVTSEASPSKNANAPIDGKTIRDLSGLPWCSIDNDDSMDLDQLTVAEALPDGAVKVMVAIADVDAVVKKGTALDEHARSNTTSVYTVAETFPMLPERLSTDLTSLKLEEERFAIVVEMTLSSDGTLSGSGMYPARVRNHAKLAYDSVALWLDGKALPPPAIGAVPGLDENLRLQDRTAQKLKTLRHLHGALDLETVQTRPVFDGDALKDLAIDEKNRAKSLIEDFMIAANGITARYLSDKHLPSMRRVVRVPKNWGRIVELASGLGAALPADPDSTALGEFLDKAKAADPLRFPDLSLSVIKLLGRGEYLVQLPGEAPVGHFGLSVKDYAHSTAPNRRFPDLIAQRLLKAAMNATPQPYGKNELDSLASQCTEKEDAANKVERQVEKSAAAMLLENRIGERFDSIVTGASDKGTWVRLMSPPIEGRLESGFEGADVGDRIRVQLASVNVQRGFIDFKKAE
jgi:VacB/RNase II family 3'-5' exoribonuclease